MTFCSPRSCWSTNTIYNNLWLEYTTPTWEQLVLGLGPGFRVRVSVSDYNGVVAYARPTFKICIFTARCTIVQSAVLRSHVICCPSVCPSVKLVDHDHIGWKYSKLIARAINPTSLLFVAQRSSTCSQVNMEKFCGENVRSTPTSITSGWIESTQPRVTWS